MALQIQFPLQKEYFDQDLDFDEFVKDNAVLLRKFILDLDIHQFTKDEHLDYLFIIVNFDVEKDNSFEEEYSFDFSYENLLNFVENNIDELNKYYIEYNNKNK